MDCFREFDLGGELTDRITKCRGRVREAKELSAVLRTGDKERFVSLFNQQVVKDFPDEFRQFHPVLTEWVRTEILPQRKIGLDHPTAQQPISPGRGGNDRVVLRWNWPPQRFSTDCLIGLCRSAPGREALPDDTTTTSRRRIQRSQWEAADACMPLNLRSTDGRIVAVWAEVDLGFKTLFSEPLILGRVP
ncbi:MAG: hypothetical protein NT069_13525 [Planctomycetota bacterium]|nr:hypothetical protein [Planctomycetota bacterium]